VSIDDSGQVNRGVRPRSFIIVGIVYLGAALITSGIVLIPLAILWFIAQAICRQELENARNGPAQFKKNFPFRFYGEIFGDFQHVFYYREQLTQEIIGTTERELKSRTPVSALEPVKITDIDKNLSNAESREFLKAEAGQTRRGTKVTLLLALSQFGNVQSVRWWVLAGGYVDHDKQFNFVAFAPLTIWFWIIPYLRKEYDIVSHIRTVYAAAYNDIDVVTQVRCLHDSVFNAMVSVLESHDIDTSDIKAQRMQVMNIAISGGRVNMGNVVQGAMNRVAATVRGAQKQ
jgi:hypothetical protein